MSAASAVREEQTENEAQFDQNLIIERLNSLFHLKSDKDFYVLSRETETLNQL